MHIKKDHGNCRVLRTTVTWFPRTHHLALECRHILESLSSATRVEIGSNGGLRSDHGWLLVV